MSEPQHRADEAGEIADEIRVEGDAPRRTYLANERTFLAWWRSGLAAMTVGFGKFGPAIGTAEDEWPFVVLGGAFVVLGAVFVFYGLHRRRVVDRALARGWRIPADEAWFSGFTIVTLVLALGLLAVLLVSA